MMVTEYWIFMLVWCFILDKLNALPVMYGKNLLKAYTWNTKIFTTIIDLISLQMHVFSEWGSLTHLCKVREPLSEKSKVWLKNQKYAWPYATEMIFQNLPITAVFSEWFIKIIWQWCSHGNLLKRIKWTYY